MGQCVVVTESGAVQASPADPCTGYVLVTPVEYAAMAANPFVLDPVDGALVSGAVAGVWLLAWAARAVRSVLSDRDSDS